VEVSEILRNAGTKYPEVRNLVSLVTRDRIEPLIGPLPDFASQDAVFTFEGLIKRTTFIARIRELLTLLQSKLGSPVDIEFAYDGKDLYLLQCRRQSFGADTNPTPIPQNLPADKVIFSAHRYASNGKVPDITHLVYVDADEYSRLPDQEWMH